MFEYKMIQIPSDLAVQAKDSNGQDAATYLEKVVNEQARQGWEFYRIDSLSVEVKAGCLDALKGKSAQAATNYSVISFRKESQ
ncbi:DUF4177 domain-containing protein [Endozoicomonas sp. YOMI1]|uniref:DUF4177 domain-containing protein n=1 Tax=Endozoicomonas sp. YOMI1 TaxID=2828739 RepID=UPI002147558E|nr:DUF4177 domain-containing protein [Endozoicomonas sp. YOMI1]